MSRQSNSQMRQPIRCPAGTLYDAAVYTECPCPSCWADRTSAKLAPDAARAQRQNIRASPDQDEPITAAPGPNAPPERLTAVNLLKRARFAMFFAIVIGAGLVGCYFAYLKLRSAEDQQLIAAHDNLSKLQKYTATCILCRHKQNATSEIAELQRQAEIAKEQEIYRAAAGDLAKLRSYVAQCKHCEFKTAATNEIKQLEFAASVFSFEVCNRTSYKVAVAIVAPQKPDSTAAMHVRGWSLIEASGCRPIGVFPRGKIYVVAQAAEKREGWYGNDQKFCVSYPGPFDQEAAAGPCQSSGRALGFREITVSDSKYTWSINGEPKFANDEFFAFRVCNQTPYQAAVAVIAHLFPDSPKYTLKGWWTIGANACSDTGRFVKGKFYATAMAQNRAKGWFGTDVRQCVEFPGAFERVDSPDYKCPSSGKIVGFHAFNIIDSDYTWTIKGKPTFSPDDFFTFEVCNQSKRRASVAVMGRDTPEDEFSVQGWHTVSAGSCESVGRFAKGTFYAMASVYGNINRGWWNKDIRLCVDVPGPFHRVNSPGHECRRNERLVPFRKFTATGPTLRWTLNE